jgi:hypothetical protein
MKRTVVHAVVARRVDDRLKRAHAANQTRVDPELVQRVELHAAAAPK